MATTLRRCAGSTRYAIEAHEAPINEFPAQKSGKDGLGRMCREHWRAYTAALRRDQLARSGTPATEPTAEPVAERPARTTRAAKVPAARPVPERVRKAKAVVAATDILAGEAYTAAVGSDEVQSALTVIATGSGADDAEAPAAA